MINGLTDDYDHPIQSLTDAMTVWSASGARTASRSRFLGKCSDAMCTSVALTMTRLGSNVALAAPPEDQMAPETQALVRANCEQSGAELTLTDDPVAAVRGADVVYTVGWWWQHTEEEKDALPRTCSCRTR